MSPKAYIKIRKLRYTANRIHQRLETPIGDMTLYDAATCLQNGTLLWKDLPLMKVYQMRNTDEYYCLNNKLLCLANIWQRLSSTDDVTVEYVGIWDSHGAHFSSNNAGVAIDVFR